MVNPLYSIASSSHPSPASRRSKLPNPRHPCCMIELHIATNDVPSLVCVEQSTIGCEFFAKPIPIPERPDQPVKLLIWDTAGQEVMPPLHTNTLLSCLQYAYPATVAQVFRSFTPNFLRGALAGIICYDITSEWFNRSSCRGRSTHSLTH